VAEDEDVDAAIERWMEAVWTRYRRVQSQMVRSYDPTVDGDFDEAIIERGGWTLFDAVDDTDAGVLALDAKYNREVRTEIERRWSGAAEALRVLRIAGYWTNRLCSCEPSPPPGNPTQSALVMLHARCLQVCGEVEALLWSGYPHGALARWRTLHEATTVMLVISHCGDEIAERYLASTDCDALQTLERQLEEQHGVEPDVVDLHRQLRRRVDVIEALYGPVIKQERGWAASLNNGKRPSIRQLDRIAERHPLRAHYVAASDRVHAGPHGARLTLLAYDNKEVWFTGPVEDGMDRACTLTAKTFALATRALIWSFDSLGRLDKFSLLAFDSALDHMADEVLVQARLAGRIPPQYTSSTS
jgi:hypothetical protein